MIKSDLVPMKLGSVGKELTNPQGRQFNSHRQFEDRFGW